MAWVKLDDRFPDHPKVRTRSDGAFRHAIRGLCFANAYLTDGVLPLSFLETVPPRFQTELLEAGIWRQQGEKIVIHDYKKYQPSKRKVLKSRKENRDRQARYRQRLEEDRGRAATPVVTADARVSHSVTNDTPSRPVPTPTKRSPQPPAGAGEVRVLRDDRKTADRQMQAGYHCDHQPRCEGYSVCKERLAVSIALKRQAVRRAS